MKRKVAKVGTLRVSPNEETLILKQERERRRKLRLQQVREQEKFIAQQIRQDVKDRKDQQLQQLAEELRAKWEAAQAEKLRALEKIYLSTLDAIGEGHRQAKENEPDLKAIERKVAVNKEKAEKRHREALKELKHHRERQLKDQTWHIKARRKALSIEKQRAAKIASLPPPPPDPLENLEVEKRLPLVKICNVDNFSVSHYHLPEAYVDREMDTEQPDARAAAVEEGKRLDALQKEEERERREQMEKANLRGSHALKMVQLTQDRGSLMKELEQMQQDDLARRRQIVSKMPQQLFEPAYRRVEIREDWQRELESAFEDMYTRNTKMRGDMVLHLKPQPLPDPSVTSVDEDLDLTVEPEAVSEAKHHLRGTEDISPLVEPQEEAREPQSRLMLKRLLNRIRNQKDQWSAKSDVETVSDTLDSGSLPIDNGPADVIQEEEKKSVIGDTENESENTVLAGNAILLHPQEQAMRIRMEEERKKKMEHLERQKQEQLELLNRLEEERKSLEAEYHKMQLQMQEASRAQVEQQSRVAVQDERPEPAVSESEVMSRAPVSALNTSAESLHIQIIREYQQRLLQQNRQHKQSVDEARKRLQEYQLLLKRRYPHLSTSYQGSPDRGQESPAAQQSLKPHTSEISNACNANAAFSSATGGSVTVPAGLTDPYNSLRMVNQSSDQRSESPGLIWSGQRSPRNGSPSQEQRETVPSSPSDVSAQYVVDHHKLPNNAKSPVIISANKNVSGDKHPQILLSRKDAQYQSPDEDRVGPRHALSVSEKHSSTSSPEEHDTSSGTSYHPLPSALSLGLPHIDFSEPSVPLTVSETHHGKEDYRPLGDFSNVQEFRERLLSSTAEIHAQQDQLKEMQVQLDRERESLLSKQISQEEHLLQKQKELEEQMRRHQESLEGLLSSREPRQRTLATDLCLIPKNERYHFMSTLLKALDDQEDVTTATGKEPSNNGLMRPPGREQRWRPSKPPVTKTKLGPFLEQHELSAIMELETPTSRRSSTGLAEHKESHSGSKDRSEREEPVTYNPDISKMSSDSTPRDLDLSRLSTSSKEQSCNESANRSRTKLSWRETLSIEASHDPVGADYPHNSASRRNPPYVPANNRDVFLKHPSIEEVSAWLVCPSTQGEAAHGRSPEAICDYLSTTTISTGSFLTSEKTDSSPGNSDVLSELQRCNYSIIGEGQESNTSPSAATNLILPEMRWNNYPSSTENRTHIQQIIEKYTKDLSASLERNLSFHAPDAAIDTSADNHFPTTFHQLDPKPDFNISTPSSARSNSTSSSRYTGEPSQTSIYRSQEQQSRRSPLSYLPHNIAAPSSSLGFINSQNMNLVKGSPGTQNVALAPDAAIDTSTDNHFPTTFHQLDPNPDFNISTPSSARSNSTSSSRYTGELSQTSINSSQEQQSRRSPLSYLPHNIAAPSSSLGFINSQNMNLVKGSPGTQNVALAPDAAIDTSADNHFPTTFHQSDPKPDFNISTPSSARSNSTSSSRYTGELSQTSINSSQEQQSRRSPLSYLPHNIAAPSSSLGFINSQNMNLVKGSPGTQNVALDFPGSFLALQPECTLNEPSVSSQYETSNSLSVHGLDNVNSGVSIQHGSSFSHDGSHDADPSHAAIQHSSQILIRQSLAEDPGSFHELMATQMTVNDSELSEHPISDLLEKNNKQSVHFEELPAVQKELHREKNAVTVGHDHPSHEESSELPGRESHSGTITAAALESFQTPRSESVTYGSFSGSSLNFLSSVTIGSSAGSVPSCVHTWDSESARGILEEPDLTLMSFNDSSVVSSEPAITLTSISDQHDGSTSQSAFQPLAAEVDASGVPDLSSAGTSLSQHFAEIDLEFTSTPGNLQEAFLIKKKHFIEQSSKRIQEIRKKDRVPKKMDLKCQQEDQSVTQVEQHSGSDTVLSDRGQLKKVVEVRVCTPEDRKLSDIEMHQRTIRLYNQLDEVKTRKEEKMRQESYAKNREKAKEFKKRTLERLRANKTK